jgi:hypothetical protein
VIHTDDPSKSTPSPVPGTSTVSFISGGVVILHDVNPPGPPAFGSWIRTDHGGFVFTVIAGQNGPPQAGNGGGPPSGPPPVAIFKLEVNGTLSGGQISGTYSFTVTDGSTPPAPLDSGTGEFTGEPFPASD